MFSFPSDKGGWFDPFSCPWLRSGRQLRILQCVDNGRDSVGVNGLVLYHASNAEADHQKREDPSHGIIDDHSLPVGRRRSPESIVHRQVGPAVSAQSPIL